MVPIWFMVIMAAAFYWLFDEMMRHGIAACTADDKRFHLGVGGAQLQACLKGVDYPAKKAELMARSRELGCPERIQTWVDGLEDRTYASPTDVAIAFGKEK